MKLLKIIFLFVSVLSLASCSNSTTDDKSNEKNTETSQVAKIQNIEVTIEGMTCEIGCAKLIESKTYKLEGVSFSKVSFEHGLGQFTLDANKTAIADIEKHINGIAGGELYKVTSSKVVKGFTDLEQAK